MPKKLFLWTAPRCISTAFERAMFEVKDSKVFHEPYAGPYHFGPERISDRYKHQQIELDQSYNEIDKLLTKEYDVDVVFSKDMAYAIENDYGRLLSKGLLDYQHTFLIRNPKQAIPSLYKASVNKQLTGWDHFDGHESGFKQLFDLYTFVKENIDEDPVVIDAFDLLTNPEGTWKAYAKATGIEYTPNMISWTNQSAIDWEVWNGWHENVSKSNGFTKRSVEEANKYGDLSKLPADVQASIAESLPCYTAMSACRLQPCQS